MPKESNRRGTDFENLICTLLQYLHSLHPECVRFNRHPRIELNNGTVAEADFELVCEFPHQIDRRLIECQDRQRSSHDVVRKIRDLKAQSPRNRFILVFKDEDFLSPPVRKALLSDGIVCYSLVGFASFLNRLSVSLGAISSEAGKPDLVTTTQRLEHFSLLDDFARVLSDELGAQSRAEWEKLLESKPRETDAALTAY